MIYCVYPDVSEGGAAPHLEGDWIWVRCLVKRLGEGILQMIWRVEFLKSSYVIGVIPFSYNINTPPEPN